MGSLQSEIISAAFNNRALNSDDIDKLDSNDDLVLLSGASVIFRASRVILVGFGGVRGLESKLDFKCKLENENFKFKICNLQFAIRR